MQVFEYCETDLELVIKDSSLIFAAADVKAYMQMILQGLAFCHERWVLHRDVKPNNFLVAPTGSSPPPIPLGRIPLSAACCLQIQYKIRLQVFPGTSEADAGALVQCWPSLRLLLGWQAKTVCGPCAGELKLADFGLARIFGSPDRKYTNQVLPYCSHKFPNYSKGSGTIVGLGVRCVVPHRFQLAA